MKKVVLSLTVMFLFACHIMAQTSVLKGTVTDDSDGSPIPGVSVFVKGTTVGTVTTPDGSYSLNVPGNASTIVFSFVGMQTNEVAYTGQSTINVALKSESMDVGEVIVVGYGTVRPEAKTGSVATVGGDALTDVPVVSMEKALAGRMAGVMVTANSGQPGAATQMRIRGTSSINAGNEPLYVVDGIPIDAGNQSTFTNTGNALAGINPNDIESVTVLKDAAAASVYGSRAANGVVLITTKGGSVGKSKFSAFARYGVSQLANDNNFRMMNSGELLNYQRDAVINAGMNPDDPNGAFYRPMSLLDGDQTDWMDHFTRLGRNQEYEISAQGGNETTKMYTSFNYTDTEGIYYGVDFSKITARVNVDHKLRQNLTIGARVNGTFMESNDVPMQSLYYSNPAFAGMMIQPWTPAYDENGKHNLRIPENSNTNPRATAQYDDQWEKQYRFINNMYLEWKPIDGLTLKTTNAAELTFTEGRRYWNPEARYNNDDATLQTSNRQYTTFTTSNTANYSKLFGNHSIRVLAGQEAMQREYKYNYVWAPSVDPNIPYPGTSPADQDEADYFTNKRTLLSFFGIFDYNFGGKYFFQTSLRRDGSSLFADGNQWGTFYSFAGSWNLHNEDFLTGAGFLNVLKLRLSYGVNGNNDIPVYQPYGVYTATQNNGVVGFRPSRASNPELRWELNKTWNLGVDFGFFHRFTGSVEVYSRNTEDMLLYKRVSQTTGYSTILTNIGSLKNTGVEFQIDGNILDLNGFTWDAGFNIAFNNSEITELAGDDRMDYADDSRLQHIVGERLFTYYLRDYYGVNPMNGEALYRDADGNITNNFNKANYIEAGSPEPKYIGGFNTSLAYKGLSLNVQGEFRGGNHVYIIENRYISSDGAQMSNNQVASANDYWKQPGDTGVNPKPVAGNSSNSNHFSTTRWLERGDYLRIRDITLSYNLPNSWLERTALSNVRIYGSALNLYTFHDVNFFDPERGTTGMGYGIYPMTKTFLGGIEISF